MQWLSTHCWSKFADVSSFVDSIARHRLEVAELEASQGRLRELLHRPNSPLRVPFQTSRDHATSNVVPTGNQPE